MSARAQHSLAGDVGQGGIVVLRSFGKFFGLAGLRLGFALSDTATVERLDTQFGPWAVAGPALEYGIRALADIGWQDAMRARLRRTSARLDALFGRFGIPVAGGTTCSAMSACRMPPLCFRRSASAASCFAISPTGRMSCAPACRGARRNGSGSNPLLPTGRRGARIDRRRSEQ